MSKKKFVFGILCLMTYKEPYVVLVYGEPITFVDFLRDGGVEIKTKQRKYTLADFHLPRMTPAIFKATFVLHKAVDYEVGKQCPREPAYW
jgi:hypothetical protein